MKIYTRIEGKWINGLPVVTRRTGFDYSGPVALLDRGQSKQVANQGMTQSGQDQANATGALASTNAALQNYNTGLNRFMQFGRQTYGSNGTFMRDANTLANTTAAAGSKGIGAKLALNAMRTGDNTANYANVAAESQRQADRDLTSQLATADQSRLAQLTAINQYGVDASKFPATVQAQLYGTSTGGASSNLGPAASAAGQPSLGQSIAGNIIGAVGTAAGGYLSKK
jgi:hypothetical protein